jgi:signal transduction histidine kinase
VEPAQVSVFVKDRGVGFDVEQIAGDRQGVRGSIIARMERHGGHVQFRSAAGAGTEVELTLPRKEENR